MGEDAAIVGTVSGCGGLGLGGSGGLMNSVIVQVRSEEFAPADEVGATDTNDVGAVVVSNADVVDLSRLHGAAE